MISRAMAFLKFSLKLATIYLFINLIIMVLTNLSSKNWTLVAYLSV